MMGKTSYGYYTLILTNISFWSLFIYNPVSQGVNRFYYEYNDENSSGIYYRLIVNFLKSISGLILLLFIAGGLVFMLAGEFYTGVLLILSGILTVFFKVSEFSSSLLNIVRERKANSIISVAERYFFIFGILLLIITDYLNLVNVLIIYSTITLITGLLKFSKFGKNSGNNATAHNSEIKSKITGDIKRYIWPFVIWGISSWLQLNGEKWVIANYLSAAELGVYAVMLNIINAMISFPTYFITDFFIPHIFKNFSDKHSKDAVKAGYFYIWINLLIVVSLIFFAVAVNFFFGDTFIRLISSESFLGSSYLLPYLTIGTGFFYIGHVLTNVGLALNNTKAYLIPKTGAGIVSVILNILLVREYGLAGVAIAINITGLVYIIYLIIINQRMIKRFEE